MGSEKKQAKLRRVKQRRGKYIYLGCRHGPDLEVIGSHKNVSDSLASHAQNPLVKCPGLGIGNAAFECRVDKAVDAYNLVILGKHGDVVLERVGDPKALVPNIRDSLVVKPVVFVGERLVQAVIKVLVVGEDDMTTNIVELLFSFIGFGQRERLSRRLKANRSGGSLTKPSGVTSVEASPPGFSFASSISHEGPFYVIE